MIRSIKLVVSCSALATLIACGGSSDGVDGRSALSTLSPEPAGTECPGGGTRIGTGFDVDGNGVLEGAEVKSSQVVCNGIGDKSGALLMNVEAEAKGTNCVDGGVKIQSGADGDRNAILDAAEISATKFVCNGSAPAAASANPAVTAFSDAVVGVSSATAITVHQATITAPGKGKIIAFSNADIYCAGSAMGLGYDCGTPLVGGNYSLTTSATGSASSGAYEYFHLAPNGTENSARTAVFDVAAAGDVTVYLRANVTTASQYGFFRRQLTLMFIPG